MIAIKIDEDLPDDLVDLLAVRQLDVTSVRLQGWSGKSDADLFFAIQPEARWLFTADKGFSDVRRYVPGTHHGIVLFRADRESRAAYIRLAKTLLETVDLASVPGALIVVKAHGVFASCGR